jgi:hypothetical protein
VCVDVSHGQLKSVRSYAGFDVTIPSQTMIGGRVAYGCDMLPISDVVRVIF